MEGRQKRWVLCCHCTMFDIRSSSHVNQTDSAKSVPTIFNESSRHRTSKVSLFVKMCHESSLHHTDNTGSFTKPRPKNPVCVLEHTILQTHHNELTALEPGLDQSTNVLSMRQVQSGIHFVQNVHGCRLELEKSQNQRKRNERSVKMMLAKPN